MPKVLLPVPQVLLSVTQIQLLSVEVSATLLAEQHPSAKSLLEAPASVISLHASELVEPEVECLVVVDELIA